MSVSHIAGPLALNQHDLRNRGVWGGFASPRFPLSRWLWRQSRRSQREIRSLRADNDPAQKAIGSNEKDKP
jgi:hypothetical protein